MLWVGMHSYNPNLLLAIDTTPFRSAPDRVSLSDCFQTAHSKLSPDCLIPPNEMDNLMRDVVVNLQDFRDDLQYAKLRANMDIASGVPHSYAQQTLVEARVRLLATSPAYAVAHAFYHEIATAISDPILTGTLNQADYGDDAVMLRNYIACNKPEFALDYTNTLYVSPNRLPKNDGFSGLAVYQGMDAPMAAMATRQRFEACCPGC